MFYGTYRLLTTFIFGLSFPVFLVYALLTGRHRDGLGQRLGLYGKDDLCKTDGPTIWLHGASVGEIKAAELLLGKIAKWFPEANLVVTAVTEQGFKMAQQTLGNKATCLMAPLDLPGASSRAIRAIRPDIYLCLETELWPNTLAGLHKSGAACFLLNARLSEKSFRRYRHFGGFSRQVLGAFSGISAITSGDAERLLALGAPADRVTVGGNVKYDLPPIPNPEDIRREWQHLLGLTVNTPALVAGSTHSGEELLLLEVFRALKTKLPGLILILAPRHLNRLDSISTELSVAGAAHDLLSQVRKSGRFNNIIVVDSMGDLATLYAVATYIFCGGSLIERGGHNVIEAARWSRPVFYGPSMRDFSDAKELLETGGGGFQVGSTAELIEGIIRLADNSELYNRAASGAGRTATSQNGAVDRQLQPVFAALSKLTAQRDLRR